MKTNLLALAAALPDAELLTRTEGCARRERESLVDLLAHLAALDQRPSVYAAAGYGSMFAYCREALRLSEDAACARIEAARACRRFPVVLDLLASGFMTLTSIRMLARHLTPENHEKVLARARGRTKHEIEALVAELAPQPDVPSSVRKLPSPAAPPLPLGATSRGRSSAWEPGRAAPGLSALERIKFTSRSRAARRRRCEGRCGSGTAADAINISLRCWRHNQYEAELIFGPHGASRVREAPLAW